MYKRLVSFWAPDRPLHVSYSAAQKLNRKAIITPMPQGSLLTILLPAERQASRLEQKDLVVMKPKFSFVATTMNALFGVESTMPMMNGTPSLL